ncbi:hypothetical protein JCM10450v2_005126 [Rhodotorula kratochvilovae]
MSSRFSALLASSRPSPTQPPTSSTRSSAPNTSPAVLYAPATPASAPAAVDFHGADSAAAGSSRPAGGPEPLSGAAVRSYEPRWTRRAVYGAEGGEDVAGAEGWFAAADAPQAGGEEEGGAYRAQYSFEHAQPQEGQRYVYHPLGAPAQAYDAHPAEERGEEGDVGGEYAFTFDSPVLVATHGADEQDFELASPYSSGSSAERAFYSPAGAQQAQQQVSPISPISPIVGVEYQQQEYDGSSEAHAQQVVYSSATQQYRPYPSQSLAFASGSMSAAPTYAPYEPLQPSPIAHYQASTSAPSYSHESFGPAGPASYPPTFSSPLSMAAYQSFSYAHTHAYEYGSTADAALEYGAAFVPPSSIPPPHRRISTGSLFTSFPPASSSLLYARASSPPRSSASLLAAGIPAYQHRPPHAHAHAPLVKPEPESPDLPPALPHSPVETPLGSPMSAASFGGGGGGGGAPTTPTKKYPSSAAGKKPSYKRRSSVALDPDYDPSPASSSSAGAAAGRPISPITGKPVKVISKRGWPPKDAHKRVYQCEIDGCGKTFGRPSARDTHMRSHSGDKPFECPIPSCLRKFSVFSNLKRHMIVHPTVDFRHVTVHDLPHIHFVPDAPGAEPTTEGGRLEWLDSEEEEGGMMEA